MCVRGLRYVQQIYKWQQESNSNLKFIMANAIILKATKEKVYNLDTYTLE